MERRGNIIIQDIKLCKDVRLGYSNFRVVLNGKRIKCVTNGNPGVWYIENPLEVKVLDIFDGQWKVVNIIEYPPQPTLRILEFMRV